MPAVPYRLQAGEPAPVQQSGTTCGSACLTVARMLVNPALAEWIIHGVDRHAPAGPAPDPRPPIARFAAYEQVVARRTNGVMGAGRRLQPPWPRALGTPPWGARHELEYGASDAAADYAVTWVRRLSGIRLMSVYAALLARVRDGRPALLYVGNLWLPRHVVLVVPEDDGTVLGVYEPSTGRVTELPEAAFTTRRLRLGGWDVPWALVWAEAIPE